jgi:uncharacterized protein (DUF1919 family)
MPYNNPFISTLIPNDLDFIKLSNNFLYYINIDPILGEPKKNTLFAEQNNNHWYIHELIPIPYPIIYLGDIEIHCIHETEPNECLNKFYRRLIRTREIIKENNYSVYILLSFSELINNHNNIQDIINNFLNNSNENIFKYFIGPSKYNNHINYINVEQWNNIELIRNSSHVYNFNNQQINTNIFMNNIFIKK